MRTPAQLEETARGGRVIEDSVTLDVAPEMVWRALTDAGELTRWFPLTAVVEPGVGGSISLSWGEQGSENVAIELWEPNRRLRTVDRRRDAAGRLVEIAVDYLIDTEGGRTRLRVVHAGFGPEAEWDQEYEGTVRGWRYELRGLRHYLSRHAGVERRVASAWARTSLTPAVSYARVIGPGGLGGPDALAGRAEGDPYRLEGAAGVFEGRVLLNQPPLDFSGTVSTLNDALLRYEFYAGSAKLWVAAWGLEASVVPQLESRLQAIIGRVAGS